MNKTINDSGIKYDEGKLRYDLIPPEAMEALAHIYTMGAVKYGANNWEHGMSWSRIIGALFRHLYSWIKGDEIDKESGKSHLWHVLWNVVALVTYEARGIGTDDRACKNKELPGFGHEPIASKNGDTGYEKWVYPNETPKIKTNTLPVRNEKVFTVNYSLPDDYLHKVISPTPKNDISKLIADTDVTDFYIPQMSLTLKDGQTYFTENGHTKQIQTPEVLLVEE